MPVRHGNAPIFGAMKRFWLSLASALLMGLAAPTLQAQDSNDTGDADGASGEETPFAVTTSSNDARDRLVLEFNWNTLLNTPDSFNLQQKGRGFNFYFYFDIPIGGDNVSFAPGIGMGTSNFFHESFLVVESDTNATGDLPGVPAFGDTYASPFPNNLDYKKNKLSLTYIDIPLELRFKTNPNERGNRFKVAVGFKGGLVIASHTKYVGTDTRPGALEGSTDFVKYKEHRIRNIQSFRYGVTGRLGYGSVNVHAFYGLSDIFDDGQGPTGNALEIGISLNPF
jgi:hypothetical protein